MSHAIFRCRTPCRVRGLKYSGDSLCACIRPVALRWSAWIGITMECDDSDRHGWQHCYFSLKVVAASLLPVGAHPLYGKRYCGV